MSIRVDDVGRRCVQALAGEPIALQHELLVTFAFVSLLAQRYADLRTGTELTDFSVFLLHATVAVRRQSGLFRTKAGRPARRIMTAARAIAATKEK